MKRPDRTPPAVGAPAARPARKEDKDAPNGLADNEHANPPGRDVDPQPGEGVDYPDPGIPPGYEGEI